MLAGRKLNDPNNHPILPWVSDLSAEDGCWRDFTKSKYRFATYNRTMISEIM